MKRLIAALAITAASALAPSQAAIVTFDDAAGRALAGASFDPGQSFSDQGLTFTYSGGSYMLLWDASNGAAPGSDGTNNLLIGSGPADAVTITQTGGGLFSLGSLTLGISFTDPTVTADIVTINGTPLAITSTATNYAVNLQGVTSVRITGLASGAGYFSADNLSFAVPEPASLLLLGAGIASLAAVRRRDRCTAVG